MRVIVVGGGVVGASVAYHMAGPDVEVLVVDRADTGRATTAAGGVVFPWPLPDTPPAMRPLGLAAAEHYPRLVADLAAAGAGAGELGYARAGGMTVVEDGPLLDQIDNGVRQMRAQPGMTGLGEVVRLAPGEPAARFPGLRPELAGVWVEGVARVDGAKLSAGLLRAAGRHWLQRRSGSAALAFTGGRVTGVTVDGELLGADAVVVAAGAWSAELCRPLGVSLPVYPHRGQTLHLTVPDHETAVWPHVRTVDGYNLVPFPGGRIVTGSTSDPDAGFAHHATLGGLDYLVGEALATAPGLAGATFVEVRTGFRPGSRDGLPLVGSIPGLSGVVVATGLDGMGLTLGPYVGSLAADLVLGREPSLDLSAFRPDR